MTARPKNGSWMADFMVAKVRYREGGFPTATAANAWELRARAALMAGDALPIPEHVIAEGAAKATGMTIDALVKHCDAIHWRTKKSRLSLVRSADCFARWAGQNRRADEVLTYQTVCSYVEFMAKNRKAGGTINRHIAGISVLVKHAVAMNLIPGKFLMPRQQEGEGRLRWFTEAEETAIHAFLKQTGELEASDLFVLLCDTGGRLGEVMTADWGCYDLKAKTLTFWDTKNGASRTVYLTKRCVEALSRRRNASPRSPLPFNGLNPTNLRTTWARLRAAIPALEDAVIHSFRHTCASRLVQRGVDLMRVKEWMGHKTIQTTLRYAHLAPKHLKCVVDALEFPVGEVE